MLKNDLKKSSVIRSVIFRSVICSVIFFESRSFVRSFLFGHLFGHFLLGHLFGHCVAQLGHFSVIWSSVIFFGHSFFGHFCCQFRSFFGHLRFGHFFKSRCTLRPVGKLPLHVFRKRGSQNMYGRKTIERKTPVGCPARTTFGILLCLSTWYCLELESSFTWLHPMPGLKDLGDWRLLCSSYFASHLELWGELGSLPV